MIEKVITPLLSGKVTTLTFACIIAAGGYNLVDKLLDSVNNKLDDVTVELKGIRISLEKQAVILEGTVSKVSDHESRIRTLEQPRRK